MCVWSLKLDFESPPTRYASTLDANAVRRNTSAAKMQCDFDFVLKLETSALRDVEARALRRKVFFLDCHPIRLPYLLFERGGYNPLYPKIQRMMLAQLEVAPDSRIVEDSIHRGSRTYPPTF